ncbi:hypothetical protein D9M73_51870 [compost metagenome]
MDREQIEALLKQAYEDGKADAGLYDAGIRYVVMDNVDGALTFTWFDQIQTLDDLIADAGDDGVLAGTNSTTSSAIGQP